MMAFGLLQRIRGRQSPPHEFFTKISNKFEALDPLGPLIDQQPLKKIALSSSCSDIGKLDIPENCQAKTKHSRVMSNQSLKNSSVYVNGKDSSLFPEKPLAIADDFNITSIDKISSSPVIGATGRDMTSHQAQETDSSEIGNNFAESPTTTPIIDMDENKNDNSQAEVGLPSPQPQPTIHASTTEKSHTNTENTDPEYRMDCTPQSENENNVITTKGTKPLPVIGRTGGLHQQPNTSKTATSKISPSPILGKAGKFHHLHQTSRSKLTHDLSCGCNDCFHFQLNNMKQVTAKTISNLVDNFIKYKAKSRYGKLENHVEDCKCVDHLVIKQTSKSQIIKRLIDNNKEKQKTQRVMSKTPTLKPKPNQPLGTQVPSNTKISRNNVMTSSASNLSH